MVRTELICFEIALCENDDDRNALNCRSMMREYSEVEEAAAMRWKYWLCGGTLRLDFSGERFSGGDSPEKKSPWMG